VKLKLPDLSTAAGRLPKTDLRALVRRARKYAAYAGVLFAVFLIAAWINLPTKAMAWRISHEAKKAGMMVTVGDVSISPFGSVTLEEVVWSFKPSHPDQVAVPFVVEEIEVDLSLLSLLIGDLSFDLEATLDEGTITGNYTRGTSESSVNLRIEDLPLYALPKLQQAVNAPVRGLFGLEVELEMPENKLENARGVMRLTCADCSVGDGETKMYVPGAKGMLADGVTMPEIRLGSIVGQMEVDQGKATMEEFEAKSEDLTLRMGGKVDLLDPFPKSRLDLFIKLLVEERLLESSDQFRLLVGTAGKTARMVGPDAGWLGFALRGSVGHPRFSGINAKSQEDRLREAREERRARIAERRKKEAAKEAEKAEKAEGEAGETPEGAFVPDPSKGAEEGEAAEQTEPRRVELAPAVALEPSAAPTGEPEAGAAGEAGVAGEGEPAGAEGGDGGAAPPDGTEPPAGEEGGEGGQEGGQEGGEAGEQPVIQ
jgi:type II secretion system protein N